NRAFSLVELSIVLVILGLLTGGILGGQSLIRAAELRSVSADSSRYRTAVYSFRDKYFALPGDMSNAVKFWGAQAGGTADGYDSTCSGLTTPATGTATCNGNGDGSIGSAISNTTIWCQRNFERFRLWQHMANAGLVEGTYSGVYDPASTSVTYPCRAAVIRQNVPASRISNAGFNVIEWLEPLSTTSMQNWILFGAHAFNGTSQLELFGAAVKAEEAWNLDTKMDDGMPFTGTVRTGSNGVTCVTAAAADATYSLNATAIACSLLMKL
ncbi:MAG: hypothetical protein DI582_04060, partial [Azospirillum brasilense]